MLGEGFEVPSVVIDVLEWASGSMEGVFGGSASPGVECSGVTDCNGATLSLLFFILLIWASKSVDVDCRSSMSSGE